MNKITQKIITANKNFRESKAFGYLIGAVITGFVGTNGYALYQNNKYQNLKKGQEEFQNYKKEREEFKLERLEKYGFDKNEVKKVIPLDSAYYFQNNLYKYELDGNDIVDNDKKKFIRNNMEKLQNITDYLERTK